MTEEKYILAGEYNSYAKDFGVAVATLKTNSIKAFFQRRFLKLVWGRNDEYSTRIMFHDAEFKKELITLLEKYRDKYKEKFEEIK